MTDQMNKQRRHFLKQTGLLLGGSGLLATQSKLQFINAALAANYSGLSDHKSLVCVFLAGGNDGFNMFIPNESSAHQVYADIRGPLAIPQGGLHPVSNSSQHAFHPRMPEVAQLYNQNKLALISNVGALYQPLNRTQYQAYDNGDTSIKVPLDLFSHSHQQEIWQTLRPLQVGSTPPGWGGLMAELLASANGTSNIPPSISLSGNNLWQSGNSLRPFKMEASGISDFNHFTDDHWHPWSTDRKNTWNAILELNRQNLLKQQTAGDFQSARMRINAIQAALANAPALPTAFPENNRLASRLETIAKIISIRESLGLKRQIFFVRHGGWDTHGNQLIDHANQLGTLNSALNAFYQATVGLGIQDSVTTFTASDFGRSATSNGDGTDHGWGNHNLVLGGAVDGGRIHGTLPNIAPGGPDDSDDAGRIIPTISVDQYGATLAKWMGMTESDLDFVFPNLSAFNNHALGRDIGFMS